MGAGDGLGAGRLILGLPAATLRLRALGSLRTGLFGGLVADAGGRHRLRILDRRGLGRLVGDGGLGPFGLPGLDRLGARRGFGQLGRGVVGGRSAGGLGVDLVPGHGVGLRGGLRVGERLALGRRVLARLVRGALVLAHRVSTSMGCGCWAAWGWSGPA